MHTGEQGVTLVKAFEGFSPVPYYCSAKVLTIGYGHTRTVRDGMRVTIEEAEELLRQDLRVAEQAVLRHIHRQLTQNQFDALVSFTFNLGGGALQRSTLRQKVNRMEDIHAVQEFLRWVYAGGKKLPGLVRRRIAEAELYASLPWLI